MIILMGVPGVGKSSVLSGVLQKKPEYKVVNYGDLMLEVFREKFGVQDRDQMRREPLQRQKQAQEEVALRLSKMKGKIILDTHCSIQTPNGYLPGLPFRLLEKLEVERLVLLSASIDEIYNRRKNDPSRTRSANRDEITEHDQMNKAYLAAYSARTGAPASIVMNHDARLAEAVERLASLLE